RGIWVRWVIPFFFDPCTGGAKFWHADMFGGSFFTSFGSANGWHTETYEFLTGVTSFFDLLFILFDERYVAPCVGPETTGVVVRGFQQFQVAFHGHLVPLDRKSTRLNSSHV